MGSESAASPIGRGCRYRGGPRPTGRWRVQVRVVDAFYGPDVGLALCGTSPQQTIGRPPSAAATPTASGLVSIPHVYRKPLARSEKKPCGAESTKPCPPNK